MRNRVSFAACFFAASILSAGCSLSPDEEDSSTLSIRLENERSAAEIASLLLDPIRISAPSTEADFSCFAVNLTGEGISPTAQIGNCFSPDNFSGRGPGITSPHFARGSAATMFVPAGAARRADVYGFYPATPQCGGTDGSVYQGYFLGSKTFDIVESTDILIPISYSGASASISCSEPTVTLIPTNVTQRDTTSSVCTYNSAAPPTAPAPPAGVGTGPSDTNYLVEDGVLNVAECETAPTEAMDMQFRFDASGIDLSTFSKLEVVWKGRGGTSGTACNGNPNQTITTGGATAWFYESNTDSWLQIGTAGTTLQNHSAIYFQPLARFVNSTYFFLRVVTPQFASGCAVIHTDVAYIKLHR